MSEIGIAVGTLLLLVLFVSVRRSRAPRRLPARLAEDRGSVSMQDMTARVSDLTPALLSSAARVTAPQLPIERGHVWASPNGRRVYVN